MAQRKTTTKSRPSSAKAEANSRKKEYQITPAGLDAAREELARLRELTDNGETILGGSEDAQNDP